MRREGVPGFFNLQRRFENAVMADFLPPSHPRLIHKKLSVGKQHAESLAPHRNKPSHDDRPTTAAAATRTHPTLEERLLPYVTTLRPPKSDNRVSFSDPQQHNKQYARSISSVGKILEHYDTDKRFPVFGFGGCPVRGSPAMHCFAVNGREHDPEVHGVESILDVYR